MYKIILLFVFFSLCLQNLTQGQKQLSEEASISLLNIGAGQDLYSVFGHSALRVKDSINKIDAVFNYGTFDFETPYFYLKFINGDLNYMLSVGEYRYFISYYSREKRNVSEQILDLTNPEKQRLFENLVTNNLPSNKYYRYDFFNDNCATRLRDQVFKATEGLIILDSTKHTNLSYRQLYSSYLQQSPWIEFGIHLLLGLKADKNCSSFNEMYLPDFLNKQFASASIQRGNNTKLLVEKSTNLLEFANPTYDESHFTPAVIFWVIAIIIVLLTLKFSSPNTAFRIFDFLLFLVVGMVGLLIAFFWFISKHDVTSLNFNIFWASPLYLLIIFNIAFNRINNIFVTIMLSIIIGCQILLLIGSQLIPQSFPSSIYPIIVILLVRTTILLRLVIYKRQVN